MEEKDREEYVKAMTRAIRIALVLGFLWRLSWPLRAMRDLWRRVRGGTS